MPSKNLNTHDSRESTTMCCECCLACGGLGLPCVGVLRGGFCDQMCICDDVFTFDDRDDEDDDLDDPAGG